MRSRQLCTTSLALAGTLACALAAVVVLVGKATAVDSHAVERATRQRVALTLSNLPYGTFALAPLQAGALSRDVGTSNISFREPHALVRDGQKVRIYAAVITLVGTRGTLIIRERFEMVNAGDALVGTGRWIVVRGTRGYAEASGGGRTAHVRHGYGRSPWSAREEGYLTLQ